MIRNQWYAILDAKELRKKNRPIGVTRLGERLVLWRSTENQVFCLFDRCCHRGAALSIGKIVHDHIQCPFHGLEYDGSGICKLIPANSVISPVDPRFHVQTYPTQEAHGFIWIWWGDIRPKYPPLPWIEDVDDSFHYYTIYDHWHAHYSRAIENQLDVVHLPFVHYNTIGRGNLTVVEGPITEIADVTITVWFMNRRENGQLPQSLKILQKPHEYPNLTFKFPHIWQNYLFTDARIVVAFTPIDDENTMVYTRFYQRFMRVPGLKQLVSWFGELSSIVILHQDRRVVETQQPKPSSLKGNEELFQGDRPIVYYRRRREELKQDFN